MRKYHNTENRDRPGRFVVLISTMDKNSTFFNADSPKNIPRLCSVGFVDSGYGYGSLPELTEVPGMGMEILELSEVPGRYVYECCTLTPGILARAKKKPGSFGYGHECCT